jgi:hypothetical protein
MLYGYAGFIVESSVSLPSLDFFFAGVYKSDFYLRRWPGACRRFRLCIHEWHAEGSDVPVLSLSAHDDRFMLRAPGLARVVLERGGLYVCPDHDLDADDLSGAAVASIEHFLLDQALPRFLAHRNKLVLHAGSVCCDGVCVGLAGAGGRGKSTLTASFDGAGYELLGDDGLVLTPRAGAVDAVATYKSLRLLPDSLAKLFERSLPVTAMADLSRKNRVLWPPPTRPHLHPSPLGALYFLAAPNRAASDGILVRRLTSREACMAILAGTFHLDVTDARHVGTLLNQVSEVANRVPAYEIAYPRDFSRLPEVRAAILSRRHEWCSPNRVAADRHANR